MKASPQHVMLSSIQRLVKKDARRIEIVDFVENAGIVSREFGGKTYYETFNIKSAANSKVKKIIYADVKFSRERE